MVDRGQILPYLLIDQSIPSVAFALTFFLAGGKVQRQLLMPCLVVIYHNLTTVMFDSCLVLQARYHHSVVDALVFPGIRLSSNLLASASLAARNLIEIC